MNENFLKFLIFSDFHYFKGVYPADIETLDTVLKRAKENAVDLVLHGGDFCNDYHNSPEIIEAYLNNKYGLDVYGVAGNHELEKGTTVEEARSYLTNHPEDCIFAPFDGNRRGIPVVYYYFDRGKFRIVCADTNYSYNEERAEWQRNDRFLKPAENILGCSLGPVQLAWLEEALSDAADKGLTCLVLSHLSFCPTCPRHSPDFENVHNIYRRINEKRPGTVLMSICGHHHTNRVEAVDKVLYFYVNTTLNGLWLNNGTPHYEDHHTFAYSRYDNDGNFLGREEIPYTSLHNHHKSWFLKDPLSAIVTVATDGRVQIEGAETEWVHGIIPTEGNRDVMPRISSGVYYPTKDEPPHIHPPEK